MKVYILMLKRLLFFAIIINLISCASSKRMMRISPLSDKNNDALDFNRTNAWPLVYKNSKSLSILWPFIDVDDNGFAVRPLYNIDKDEHSILFPLSGWNKDEGWALTGYWGQENIGIFPVCNFGDDFNYTIPFWWDYRGDKVDSYGLFPVFGKMNNIYHLGPIYTDWNAGYGGVLPLIHCEKKEGWIFPLYYQKNNDACNEKKLLLGGLGNYKHYQNGNYKDYLVPFYYISKNEKGTKFITFLFGCGWDKKEKTNMFSILGPLFYYDFDKTNEYSAILWPLLEKTNNRKNYAWHFSPLVSVSKSFNRPTALYSMSIFDFKKTDDSFSWRIWPLISHSEGKTDFLYDFLTVIQSQKEKFIGRNKILPLKNDFSSLSVLWGILYKYASWNNYNSDKKSWQLNLPLFIKSQNYNQNFKEVVPNFKDSSYQKLLSSSKTSFLFCSYKEENFKVWKDNVVSEDEYNAMINRKSVGSTGIRRKDVRINVNNNTVEGVSIESVKSKQEKEEFTKKQKKILFKLFEKNNIKISNKTDISIKKGIKQFIDKNSTTNIVTNFNIPIIYNYEKSEKKSKWSFLWGVTEGAHSKKAGRCSVLKYLYRYIRKDKKVTRDIFPFIGYDTTPKTTKFSFLWRFFNIETDENSTKGHFLFIPWSF